MSSASSKGSVSLKQALNRMHSGHAEMLKAVGANRPFLDASARDSEWRGAKVMRETLLKWGAVDASGITEFGVQLLTAWQYKHPTPDQAADNLLALHGGDIAATRKSISELAYGNVSVSCRNFYGAADRVLESRFYSSQRAGDES